VVDGCGKIRIVIKKKRGNMRVKINLFEKKVEKLTKTERTVFYVVVFSIFLSFGMMVGFMIASERKEELRMKEDQLRIEVEDRLMDKLIKGDLKESR